MVKCADTKDYGKVVPGVPFSERSMFIQFGRKCTPQLV